MNHKLNTITFTIRTADEIIAVEYGIANALKVVNNIDTTATGVFFDGGHMTAPFFAVWGNRINTLINTAKVA